MRKVILFLAALVACLAAATVSASADPITCPPGQVGTFNPSDGGWTCVNQGGNTNLSEDPRSPNAGKGDFSK